MNKKQLIKKCLINDESIETYPFKDSATIVIRHKNNKKWFALIFDLENTLYVNLKCNPINGTMLKDLYNFITPAWHMNKTHWIKIDIQKAPADLVDKLIQESYNLTL